MRRAHLTFAVLLIGVAAVLMAPHVVHACPTCKDGMDANDPEHAGMVRGYFYSILFMMSMPYILISAFGLYMYREVKKARRQKEAQAAALAAKAATTQISHVEHAPADADLLEV